MLRTDQSAVKVVDFKVEVDNLRGILFYIFHKLQCLVKMLFLHVFSKYVHILDSLLPNTFRF